MVNASTPRKPNHGTKILQQRNPSCPQDKTSAAKNSQTPRAKASGSPEGPRRALKSQAKEKKAIGGKAPSLFPPLVPKPSAEPKPSKVAFQAAKQAGWSKRRLSIPEESHQAPQRSILKKRNSICTDSLLHGGESSLQLAASLWNIPWERETHFPHLGPKGLLLFHCEAIPVPPVQRRLSLKDSYSYSQEFVQALSDLQSRPASRHAAQTPGLLSHQKAEAKKPMVSKMSKHEHFSTREELLYPMKTGSPARRFSE